MKQSLIHHIKQIFEVLNIKTDYSVYDYANDILPDWLQGVELKSQFIVCCDATFDKQYVQGFIHKELFKTGNYYYWFEGEDIYNRGNVNEVVKDIPCVQTKYSLKASTRLSAWLDNYLFKILNAEYAPDFQKFEYNLSLSHEDNLKYLGTYFPRSYAEIFCIFDNVFTNDVIKSKYALKPEVSILSVGCGTGGDIIGLLTIINKYFNSIKTINIVAVDGNEDALNIMSLLIEQANRRFHKKMVLTTKQVVFDKISARDIKSSFDFIITSKFINEIINRGRGGLDNSYYDFVNVYSPMLKDDGFMLILDVTTKVGDSNFCPILLNKQVNQFVSDHPEFVSIIPIPCASKGNCQIQCFSQKEFTVSHSKCANDKSRVSYRLIVKQNAFQELQLVRPDTQYQIHPEKYCGQGSWIADGFCLPSTLPVEKKANNIIVVDQTESFKKAQNIDVNEVTVQESNEEKPNTIQIKQLREAYVIDTNAFIYAPNIIEKIAEEYPIFVSAKVVDELDHRKYVTSGNDKKKIQKALKSINMTISNGRIQTITSDARLLPADFDRRSPDNLILSVVLKLKKMGYIPILVTSDNGFQAKAKTLQIKTISYTKVKSKI